MDQSESTEDYLEAILRLSKTGRAVRQVDVSEFMGYSKASISKAVSALKRSGFLMEAAHGSLVLTPKGKRIAESVYERHRFFADMLIALGVEETTAQKDACRMEHAVSEESFAALKTLKTSRQ